MSAEKFRKRPIEVEAIQVSASNLHEVADFMGGEPKRNIDFGINYRTGSVFITTREGVMKAELGDWIIAEPFPTSDRKFYPCKPELFAATYDRVNA